MRNKSSNNGFTLVELLVSIFILGLALTAIFSVLNTNIKSATTIKNNYTASLLAQEGMEVVRNIRDNDWLKIQPFGTSIGDGVWSVQYDSPDNSPALPALGNTPNAYIKFDPTSKMFSYSSGDNTIFKRKITISSTAFPFEKIIEVEVSWSEGSIINKSIKAEDHLFDWR